MNKRTITAIIVIAIIILIGIFGFVYIEREKNNDNTQIIEETIIDEQVNNIDNKTIEFLKSVHGLKIENVELINNPVGFDGVFLAPKEAIKNGVDYFLKESKNDKINDVKIDIGSGYIKLNVDYNIINNIITPIEFKVIPSLDSNHNLVLKIDDVKFLDLKIANWIVNIGLNNFIKDWFTSDMDVKFNDGNVVIYKSNFKGVYLNKISINSKDIKIDMSINMEEIENL
jgi:hypothetical protein